MLTILTQINKDKNDKLCLCLFSFHHLTESVKFQELPYKC